jgi:hypothetical protein
MVDMTETPSKKRAKTRKIVKLINALYPCVDFKEYTFIKKSTGYVGMIIMFEEPIKMDEPVEKEEHHE